MEWLSMDSIQMVVVSYNSYQIVVIVGGVVLDLGMYNILGMCLMWLDMIMRVEVYLEMKMVVWLNIE